MSDYGVEDAEDLDLRAYVVDGKEIGWYGVGAETGLIYVGGDAHPRGSANAMVEAVMADVPYVPVSAVQVLFPLEWIRGECLADPDRLRMLNGMERYARG